MNRTELKERLNEVFRDVFDDSRIIVNENTTSDDIETGTVWSISI